jgi:hypothetical protein
MQEDGRQNAIEKNATRKTASEPEGIHVVRNSRLICPSPVRVSNSHLSLNGEYPRSSVQSGEVKSDAVPSREVPGKAEGNYGFVGSNDVSWRGGRVVECAGFENRSARKGSGSSNLPLSVSQVRFELREPP